MNDTLGLLRSLRWPLAIVALGVLVLLGWLAFLRWCSPGAFTRVDVTTRFIASLPQISRAPGGLLELATATATETFRRANERHTAWGWIYLGATVSEIRVPVTYRYHLKLAGKWNIEIAGSVCRVLAPPIEPTLPPALHTDSMEKRLDAGWARFDGSEQLDTLEREITPTITRYAGEPSRIALVREHCRKTVEEFVRAWLMRERQWPDENRVEVSFADETEVARSARR